MASNASTKSTLPSNIESESVARLFEYTITTVAYFLETPRLIDPCNSNQAHGAMYEM